jgi:protein SCO1/2
MVPLLPLLIPFAVLAGSLLITKFAASPSSSRLQRPSVYEGTELQGPAPDFRLIDQNGASMALLDFRGKVVILTFLDSRCQDVCPLTALHLRLAYEQLKRSDVDVAGTVFLGINVNAAANTPEDVMAFTKEYGLDRIPSWRFLTGRAEELEPVWKAYGITVFRQEAGEILHTSGVFLIDQRGQKRWYISASLDKNLAQAWPGPVLSELLVKHVRQFIQADRRQQR